MIKIHLHLAFSWTTVSFTNQLGSPNGIYSLRIEKAAWNIPKIHEVSHRLDIYFQGYKTQQERPRELSEACGSAI